MWCINRYIKEGMEFIKTSKGKLFQIPGIEELDHSKGFEL